MYRIDDQTVLEEYYDENYQPTEEGPYSFMLYIAGQLYWLFVVFKYIKQITNLESDYAV